MADPHKREPDREQYTDLLKCCIEEFFKAKENRVFILADAYDEFLSTKEEIRLETAMAEREDVRSSLSLLGETGRAKILITTRHHLCQELQNTFPTSKVTEVHGDEKDMRFYLENRLRRLPSLKVMEDEIIEKLMKANEKDKW